MKVEMPLFGFMDIRNDSVFISEDYFNIDDLNGLEVINQCIICQYLHQCSTQL